MSSSVQVQVDSVRAAAGARGRLAAWQFGISRSAAVISCLLAYLAARLEGGPRVLVVLVLLLFAAAAITVAQTLAVRSTWYQEPGTIDPVWGRLLGAGLDAALLVALATALPAIAAPTPTYPAVAIVKIAVLAWLGVLAWTTLRAAQAPRLFRGAQLAIIAAGGLVSWLLADRFVPAMWLTEQALACAGVAILIVAVVVATRRIVRNRVS